MAEEERASQWGPGLMEEGAISSSRLAGVDLCVLSLVGSLPTPPSPKVDGENVAWERDAGEKRDQLHKSHCS